MFKKTIILALSTTLALSLFALNNCFGQILLQKGHFFRVPLPEKIRATISQQKKIIPKEKKLTFISNVWQSVSVDTASGDVIFDGNNPNGNGSVSYQHASVQWSSWANGYHWRVGNSPPEPGYVQYDVTLSSGVTPDSIDVFWYGHATTSGGVNYTYLYLEINGTVLFDSTDWQPPDRWAGYYVRLPFSFFSPGTNYIRVGCSEASYTYYALTDIGVVWYGWSVACTPDPYETDDDPAHANWITTEGTRQTHNFCPEGDHDWVKFSATSGVEYTIETSNLAIGSDTYMYLYEPDGSTEITHDDDSGPGLASLIVWTCPSSETYYVMIRHYSSTASGDETRYDISVSGGTGPGGLLVNITNVDATGFPHIVSTVSVQDATHTPIGGLGGSNFQLKEDGVTETISVTPIGGGDAKADIIFVFDDTGSMAEEIVALRNNVNHFADLLAASSINFALGLVTFKDDYTIFNGGVLTTSVPTFQGWINGLVADGGGDIPEDAFDALEAATTFSFRAGAQRIFILITDAPPHTAGDGSGFTSLSLADIVAILQSHSVTCYVVAIEDPNYNGPASLTAETGGTWYNIYEDFTGIIDSISGGITGQYLVSYDTHNASNDCTWRHIWTQVSYNTESGADTSGYKAPCVGGGVPIFPHTINDRYMVGEEFWVDVHVGTASNPVSNLFGVSFVLNYTHTEYIDVVTPYSANVIPGDFLGTDLVYYSDVNESQGKVSVGISRKAPAGGVNGHGIVLRVKFVASLSTPNNTRIDFTITDIYANNPSGTSIPLTPDSWSINIISGLEVWPGDTNNSGYVDQADVLPIGLYWHYTGPTRPGATTAWIEQICPPWSPQNATFADANGSGTVDQADVLPIGLNWHRSHSITSVLLTKGKISNQSPTLQFEVKSSYSVGQEDSIPIIVKDVANLFGLSFIVSANPKDDLEFLSVDIGSFMGDDLVSYTNIDNDNGNVAVGISRKAGQGGVDGTGPFAIIRIQIRTTATPGSSIKLSFENVVANDPEGAQIVFATEDTTISIGTIDIIDDRRNGPPTSFKLFQNYPNPFNPSTTIKFSLKESGHVSLTIYNALGEVVTKVIDQEMEAGYHSVVISSQNMATGIYLYQIRANEFTSVKKMIVIK